MLIQCFNAVVSNLESSFCPMARFGRLLKANVFQFWCHGVKCFLAMGQINNPKGDPKGLPRLCSGNSVFSGFGGGMVSIMNWDAIILHDLLCCFICLTRWFPIWMVYFVPCGDLVSFQGHGFENVVVMDLLVFGRFRVLKSFGMFRNG